MSKQFENAELLLYVLLHTGFCSSDQAQIILKNEWVTNTHKKLLKMVTVDGFLEKRELKAFHNKALYYITKEGIEHIANVMDIDLERFSSRLYKWTDGNRNLLHTIATNHWYYFLQGLLPIEKVNWYLRALYLKGEASGKSIKPDAMVEINGREYLFEIDLVSEDRRMLTQKMLGYSGYLCSNTKPVSQMPTVVVVVDHIKYEKDMFLFNMKLLKNNVVYRQLTNEIDELETKHKIISNETETYKYSNPDELNKDIKHDEHVLDILKEERSERAELFFAEVRCRLEIKKEMLKIGQLDNGAETNTKTGIANLLNVKKKKRYQIYINEKEKLFASRVSYRIGVIQEIVRKGKLVDGEDTGSLIGLLNKGLDFYVGGRKTIEDYFKYQVLPGVTFKNKLFEYILYNTKMLFKNDKEVSINASREPFNFNNVTTAGYSITVSRNNNQFELINIVEDTTYGNVGGLHRSEIFISNVRNPEGLELNYFIIVDDFGMAQKINRYKVFDQVYLQFIEKEDLLGNNLYNEPCVYSIDENGENELIRIGV